MRTPSFFINNEVFISPSVNLLFAKSAPKRRELFASDTSPVMAEQDPTRSLSEAVSRAISETISAVIAQVSI